MVIPARLASSRLPGKPLKKIGNKTLIRHSINSAKLAGVYPYALSDSIDVLKASGVLPLAQCMLDECLTGEPVDTGTDRVAEFVERVIGWDNAPDWIINVQGDMPFGTAPFIKLLISSIKLFPDADVLTPACRVPFVNCFGDDFYRDVSLHHVGMYAFKKDALCKFYENRNNPAVREREIAYSLEQCRCDALGLKVVCVVEDKLLPPLEVNTQEDLDRINEIVERTSVGHYGFNEDERAGIALAGGG